MRFLLTTYGSTGDLYPMLGIGSALLQAGHEVRLACTPAYREDVTAAGLGFVSLPPEGELPDVAYWMNRLLQAPTPLRQIELIYESLRPFVPEIVARLDRELSGPHRPDALVGMFLLPFLGPLAARHGVPYASAVFAPGIVPSETHGPMPWPPGVPRWSLGALGPLVRRFHRWSWRTADRYVTARFERALGRELAAAGLPSRVSFFRPPAGRVLVTVSPALFAPAWPSPPEFRWIGYCRWQPPGSPEPPAPVPARERVPVLTFGSMAYSHPQAWMERLGRHWPAGRPLVVQEGWARFQPPPGHPSIRTVGKVAHDHLFTRASVVIHHGGAGTTASALHAGVPQIVVPHIAEQPYWAAAVRRLGCGRTLALARWPESLAATVDRVLADGALADRALAVARHLRTENGGAAAVRELEAWLTGAGEPQRSRRTTSR